MHFRIVRQPRVGPDANPLAIHEAVNGDRMERLRHYLRFRVFPPAERALCRCDCEPLCCFHNQSIPQSRLSVKIFLAISLVNCYATFMSELKPISSRLPLQLIKRLKASTKASGRKLEAILAEALTEWLEREKVTK